jgi:hypothetical protein
MSIKTNRAMAAAAAASIALTAFGLTPAAAAPVATEASYRHDGGAAAHAGRVYPTCANTNADFGQARDRCAFVAIAGTIAAIAAAQHDRDGDYGRPYGYGYGPAPYAYSPRYGAGGRWGGHWHRR